MFPRLPFLPARYAHLQPVLLAVIATAAIVAGLLGDRQGLALIGGIGLAGAVLGIISARVTGSPEPQDEEKPSRD